MHKICVTKFEYLKTSNQSPSSCYEHAHLRQSIQAKQTANENKEKHQLCGYCVDVLPASQYKH